MIDSENIVEREAESYQKITLIVVN